MSVCCFLLRLGIHSVICSVRGHLMHLFIKIQRGKEAERQRGVGKRGGGEGEDWRRLWRNKSENEWNKKCKHTQVQCKLKQTAKWLLQSEHAEWRQRHGQGEGRRRKKWEWGIGSRALWPTPTDAAKVRRRQWALERQRECTGRDSGRSRGRWNVEGGCVGVQRGVATLTTVASPCQREEAIH